MFHLAGLGGEQFVEFGILWEVIRKGQDDIVEKQQPVARLGVGHIGKLFGRNIQPLRQDLPVARRLVEHIDEVAVLQDIFDLRGGKQVFGVLGRPGWLTMISTKQKRADKTVLLLYSIPFCNCVNSHINKKTLPLLAEDRAFLGMSCGG